MIHPSASEVLATVMSSFSKEIIPDLTSIDARSSAATIEHLLRHVHLRIEIEGDVLMRDIARLRALLAAIADRLESFDEACTRRLRDVLKEDPANLWTLARQGAEAMRLRAALVGLQEEIDVSLSERLLEEDLQSIRAMIANYIAEQLADEASLIEPAFSGKGPRR